MSAEQKSKIIFLVKNPKIEEIEEKES